MEQELNLNKLSKKYSYVLPSLPDERDVMYVAGSSNRDPVSLAEYRGPILNQGRFGACVGFGTAGMLHSFFNRMAGVQVNFNPWWIWYHQNNGSYPRDAFQNLIDIGVCESSDWTLKTVKDTPPDLGEDELIKFKGYKRFNLDGKGIDSIKDDFFHCIGKEKLPIGITMAVHKEFETFTASSGKLEVPGDNKGILGYHWVYIDEVDEDGVALVNSWTKRWGKNGTAHMPWEYVRKYVTEAWSLDPKLP